MFLLSCQDQMEAGKRKQLKKQILGGQRQSKIQQNDVYVQYICMTSNHEFWRKKILPFY